MVRTSTEVVRACLAELAHAWLENESPALLREPDAVHRMRVTSRRLRAVLRVWGPALSAHTVAVADGLRWVAHALGEVRDLEVLEQRLLDEAGTGSSSAELAGLTRASIDAQLERARAELEADFGSRRFASIRSAVQDLGDARMAHGWKRAPADRLVKLTHARCRAALHAWDRVGLAPDLEPLPDQLEGLHHARRVAKSARYVAEALGSQGISGSRPKLAALGNPEAWGSAFREVADALGRVQDSVVAERYLRCLAEGADAGAAAELVSLADREARARRTALGESFAAVAAAREVIGPG